MDDRHLQAVNYKDRALQRLVDKYLRVTGKSDEVMLKDVIKILLHPDVLPFLKFYIRLMDN